MTLERAQQAMERGEHVTVFYSDTSRVNNPWCRNARIVKINGNTVSYLCGCAKENMGEGTGSAVQAVVNIDKVEKVADILTLQGYERI